MRMNKFRIVLALVALLAAVPASAEIGTIDDVPAATLLLPYFEVDLDDPDGRTTLFSINNASAAPAIAHVELWGDFSVPTLDFNLYLTGYDVVTVNLRDLFVDGIVPQTSHTNSGGVSPVGEFSLTTNPITGVGPGTTSCNDQSPLPPLPQILLDNIRNAHTGQVSAVLGGRAGQDLGDNVARGYITVDSVSVCTLEGPSTTAASGYFQAGGTGLANNQNILWGDYFYVDVANNFAQGETLVHIEATGGTADPDMLGPANYTFYRRYATLGEDGREGLGSTWAMRFVNGGAFTGGTDIICWRDAKQNQGPVASTPAWYPLTQSQIVIFDEMENPDVPSTTPFSPPIPGSSILPCPAETNRVAVGGATFPVPWDFGWLYLNLNTTIAGQVVPFDAITQNHVSTIMSAEGRFSAGFDAIQLDNVTDPGSASDIILPICDGDPDPAGC